jgi:hypothetical protein
MDEPNATKLYIKTFDGYEPAIIVSASWVIWQYERNPMPDHACEQCVPNGDSLIADFQCAYHRALEAKELQRDGDAESSK